MKKSISRTGFTLIELLIVVVIIGILAAIAIPKFANTKNKAYMAAMKTDLRNLATAQEGYFSDNQSYSTSLGATGVNFTPSSRVSITMDNASTKGWAATAKHAALPTTTTCSIKVGDQAGTTRPDGVVKCP